MSDKNTLQKKLIKELNENYLDKYADILSKKALNTINIKILKPEKKKKNKETTSKSKIKSILNALAEIPKHNNIIGIDNLDTGISKIGGQPDLPENFSWPYREKRPLSFLAQINLNDTKDLDIEKLLPESGMLYFFYDTEEMPWGINKKDKSSWKIYYIKEIDNLIKTHHPDYKNNDYYYEACKVIFNNYLSLPGYENISFDRSIKLNDEDEESYIEYIIDPLKQNTYTCLLGYPITIQNDEMEIECAKINLETKPSKSKEYKKEIQKASKEWILLFQLDSETNAKMMWGDCGKLYFWIKKEELKNKNFDNVWMILQCS
ncbi:MAG: YwqG family protein [Vampirovibrionia bacterium]